MEDYLNGLRGVVNWKGKKGTSLGQFIRASNNSNMDLFHVSMTIDLSGQIVYEGSEKKIYDIPKLTILSKKQDRYEESIEWFKHLDPTTDKKINNSLMKTRLITYPEWDENPKISFLNSYMDEIVSKLEEKTYNAKIIKQNKPEIVGKYMMAIQ